MSWEAFCKCCSQSTAVESGAQECLVIGHSWAVRVYSRSERQTPCLQAPRVPPAPTLPFLTLPLRIRASWIRDLSKKHTHLVIRSLTSVFSFTRLIKSCHVSEYHYFLPQPLRAYVTGLLYSCFPGLVRTLDL